MAFEIVHDGFVRRYTLHVPPDWTTVVEQEGFLPDGTHVPLVMLVLLGDGRINEGTSNGAVTIGMAEITGITQQVLADNSANPFALGWRLYYSDPSPAAVWPKYVAVLIEGLDPTDQLGRPVYGFSGKLQPHDLGPLEVVYPSPRVLGETALVTGIVARVRAQLTKRWTDWYGYPPPGGEAIPEGQVFLVGWGRAATTALEMLDALDPITGLPVFGGAALVVGPSGGSNGGAIVNNLAFPGVAPPASVNVLPVTPSGNPKKILAICAEASHRGNETDDARLQTPTIDPVSAADLAANGVPTASITLLARAQHTVFGSLAPWADAMGAGSPKFLLA